MTSRQALVLTPEEQARFDKLRPEMGEAYRFWRHVAHSRGLDYQTIIGDDFRFSALPYGHTKHWCWPSQLRVK